MLTYRLINNKSPGSTTPKNQDPLRIGESPLISSLERFQHLTLRCSEPPQGDGHTDFLIDSISWALMAALML